MTANPPPKSTKPQAIRPAASLAKAIGVAAVAVRKMPLLYSAKLPLDTASPRICKAKLPWPSGPQRMNIWSVGCPVGNFLSKQRARKTASYASESGRAIPIRRYDIIRTGTCYCGLSALYRHITPPPAAALRAAIRGRRTDGGTKSSPGASLVANTYGRPMEYTTAIATLIYHKTKATVPHLLLQSRSTVKAVI